MVEQNWRQVTTVPLAPARPSDGHKGTFGSVLVVGGSRGMAGAVALAGQAALHSGAGLVTVAAPSCVADIVAQFHPAYMTAALPCDGAYLSLEAESPVDELVQGKQAIALGPGLGKSGEAAGLVQQLYAKLQLPLVLDADGLNAFVGCEEKLKNAGGPRILTPHPGEFARLLGRSVAEVEQKREALAVSFAECYGVVCILKGEATIVTDGRRLYRNTTGSTALSTGGSGDVLTGLIAGLTAQGMECSEAAQLGVWLHGKAGELAGAKYSEQYTSAVEVLSSLSNAWLLLRE